MGGSWPHDRHRSACSIEDRLEVRHALERAVPQLSALWFEYRGAITLVGDPALPAVCRAHAHHRRAVWFCAPSRRAVRHGIASTSTHRESHCDHPGSRFAMSAPIAAWPCDHHVSHATSERRLCRHPLEKSLKGEPRSPWRPTPCRHQESRVRARSDFTGDSPAADATPRGRSVARPCPRAAGRP